MYKFLYFNILFRRFNPFQSNTIKKRIIKNRFIACRFIASSVGFYSLHSCCQLEDYISSNKEEKSLLDSDLSMLYKLTDEVIGAGAYGVVIKGINKITGEDVAVKIMSKSNTSAQKFWSEVDHLRIAGKHPNIMSIQGVYESANSWYIIQDLATGGELFDRLIKSGAYSEKEASETLAELCDALCYLHSKGIVHGDIKPENILLHKDHMYLVDFGVSFRIGEKENNKELNGTLFYSSPEALLSSSKSTIGPETDMFSFGILMYILLIGSHPFDRYNCGNDDEIQQRIIKGEYQFDEEQLKNISPSSKDLIFKLLDPNPTHRITAENALEHEWLKKRTLLNPKPLKDIKDRLERFQNGRRRLRASILAVLLASFPSVPANKYSAAMSWGLSSNKEIAESKVATVMSALGVFDKDNKGFISKDDLKRVTRDLGHELNDDQIAEMVSAAHGDPDQDSSNIPYEAVKMALCSLRSKKFLMNDIIIQEGNTDHVFYLLIDGEVETSCKNPMVQNGNSSDVILRRLKTGNYFGEVELLDGLAHPRIATYKCISPICKVLILTTKDYLTIAEHYKAMVEKISRNVSASTQEQLVKCVDTAIGNINRIKYKVGDVLVEENEDKSSFFVVVKGKAKVIQKDGTIVETLEAGDYFPLSGLPGHVCLDSTIEDKSKETEVVCIEPTEIIEINSEIFRSFFNSSQFLAAFFQEQVKRRVLERQKKIKKE